MKIIQTTLFMTKRCKWKTCQRVPAAKRVHVYISWLRLTSWCSFPINVYCVYDTVYWAVGPVSAADTENQFPSAVNTNKVHLVMVSAASHNVWTRISRSVLPTPDNTCPPSTARLIAETLLNVSSTDRYCYGVEFSGRLSNLFRQITFSVLKKGGFLITNIELLLHTR